MAKASKKSVVQKIADAVDHVIHPDQKPDSECPVTDAPCEKDCAPDECKATVAEETAHVFIPSTSSSQKSDYASHPKFAKFKSSQGAK